MEGNNIIAGNATSPVITEGFATGQILKPALIEVTDKHTGLEDMSSDDGYLYLVALDASGEEIPPIFRVTRRMYPTYSDPTKFKLKKKVN
jgi:hypothetical protein